MASAKNRELYNELARTCAPDDFWGQVKRTVGGNVIDDHQIQLIVDAIIDGTALEPDDYVLDLCCGNGALSNLIFERCSGGVGVDFAENLIAIAQANFQRLPNRRYVGGDAERFVLDEREPSLFTKAFCYGSFQLLSHEAALGTLTGLRTRFSRLSRLFIGNLPDRARIHDFYYAGVYVPGIEDDHESPIGIWRTEGEFTDLARRAGWTATFRRMDPAYHAARYRYNALLAPDPG